MDIKFLNANFCSFVLLSKIIVNTHASVLTNKKAAS